MVNRMACVLGMRVRVSLSLRMIRLSPAFSAVTGLSCHCLSAQTTSPQRTALNTQSLHHILTTSRSEICFGPHAVSCLCRQKKCNCQAHPCRHRLPDLHDIEDIRTNSLRTSLSVTLGMDQLCFRSVPQKTLSDRQAASCRHRFSCMSHHWRASAAASSQRAVLTSQYPIPGPTGPGNPAWQSKTFCPLWSRCTSCHSSCHVLLDSQGLLAAPDH